MKYMILMLAVFAFAACKKDESKPAIITTQTAVTAEFSPSSSIEPNTATFVFLYEGRQYQATVNRVSDPANANARLAIDNPDIVGANCDFITAEPGTVGIIRTNTPISVTLGLHDGHESGFRKITLQFDAETKFYFGRDESYRTNAALFRQHVKQVAEGYNRPLPIVAIIHRR